jgi:hypothetical protein
MARPGVGPQHGDARHDLPACLCLAGGRRAHAARNRGTNHPGDAAGRPGPDAAAPHAARRHARDSGAGASARRSGHSQRAHRGRQVMAGCSRSECCHTAYPTVGYGAVRPGLPARLARACASLGTWQRAREMSPWPMHLLLVLGLAGSRPRASNPEPAVCESARRVCCAVSSPVAQYRFPSRNATFWLPSLSLPTAV